VTIQSQGAGVESPAATRGSRAVSVEFRAVSAAYGDRQVLDAVDLSLAAGEMVALVGPNGAGKSTLLRCLTGLHRPSAGVVAFDGVPVEEIERQVLARRVAVVPQESLLPFSIRVEELVELGRLPHEHPLLGPRAADRAAVAMAIERVGIDDLVGRDVRQLSRGERQLVLFALAVAQEAPLVVLDEPTVHLDLEHQVRVMELLRDLNRSGSTVLVVLHDLRLAAHFLPRVVVLERGAVVADGPPGRVLDDALIRRVFRVDPRFVGWPSESPTSS
jgi:ABC-type cobalamin/Fe3+-siderophores transport system ATPase subunit